MISRKVLGPGLVVALLCVCGTAEPQETRTTINNGNALACRNKGDIERALGVLMQGPEAYLPISVSLLLSGACIELKRGTPVAVLEVTRHPTDARFHIARVRPAGDRNEHYVNAMYVEP